MNYKHDWFFVYLHNVLLILLCVIFAHATDEEFVVGTALHRCVFFAQMHGTSTTYIPRFTLCALIALHPIPIAKQLEAVVPYVHKTVVVDIALVEVAPDAQTP